MAPRILVIDDEPRIQHYLKLALTQRGHDVRVASGRDEALRIVEEFTPEVLVVDWMLRDEEDGLALAATLRERVPAATIVITGHPAGALAPAVASGEVFAILEKPFAPDELVETIRRATADRSDLTEN